MNLSTGDTRLIISTCRKAGLGLQAASYVLATAWHETAHTMKPVRKAFWLDEAWRKENLRYWPWYGRGFVQLTWEANYKRTGGRLGIDLASDPDRAMQPDIAARVLVRGMVEGWFTGKKLSDYIDPGSADYINARRIVNGTDRAGDIAALAQEYEWLLKSDGYDKKPESPFARIIRIILRYFRGDK